VSEDIRQIAHTYLRKVKPSGNEDVMAVCPFHSKSDGSEEKNPSFAMNVYSGLWYCHSCHSRGNLYTFLRDVGMPRAEIKLRYQGMIDAAEQHAPARSDPLNPIEPTKEPLDESFLGLFDTCPVLMLEEGYPEELLRKFDVGFDEKHLRVTFPLRDARGKLVGISGRAVTDAKPRYKVYDKEYLDFGLPERATQKRALLWNVHNAFTPHVFEVDPAEKYLVVAEGFKAVMRIAQAGISNVVGLLGSYMSTEQQQLIERASDGPIFLMLDNDDAGRSGTLDAGRRLLKTVPSLYVVTYDAQQPSDLQPPAIQQALLDAQLFAPWFIQQQPQY